jgi:hypothetical protein
MVTAVVSGVVWDLTGIPASAFVPIGLCAFILMTVPLGLSFGSRADAR